MDAKSETALKVAKSCESGEFSDSAIIIVHVACLRYPAENFMLALRVCIMCSEDIRGRKSKIIIH